MGMDELLDPIFAEMRRRDLSEAAVSRDAVGNPSALKNLRVRRGSGSRNHPIENLQAIAQHLGLEFYIGPPRTVGGGPNADVASSDFASVPRYNAQLSAGPGANHDGDLSTGAIAFRRDWLAREGISPASAMVLPVKGDSMAPTLCDGDLVMIDRRKVTPTGRKIYAMIGPDGEARVKRIERLPTALLLHSDNDGFPTELVAPADADRIRILGQVVWWGHTARE